MHLRRCGGAHLTLALHKRHLVAVSVEHGSLLWFRTEVRLESEIIPLLLAFLNFLDRVFFEVCLLNNHLLGVARDELAPLELLMDLFKGNRLLTVV